MRAAASCRRSGSPAWRPPGTTIVNRAPPSAQFSAQIRPRSTASSPRAIAQAHAGAGRAPSRGGAAIEALEQVRQIGRRQCPGRDRAPQIVSPSSVDARRARRSASPAGEYCAAFSSRCASAAAVSRGSRRTSRPASDRAPSTSRPRSACSTCARARPRRSPTDATQRGSVATAPASMRAISRMFWNSRVRRSTSVRISVALLAAARRSSSHDACEVVGGHADGRQRRAQIVAERREQRRLQLLALPRQLGRLALLEKLRALDRDRGDAAERVERAGVRSAGRPTASRPIGLVPSRSGTSRTAWPPIASVRCPA